MSRFDSSDDFYDWLNGPYPVRVLRRCQDCGEREKTTDDSPTYLCGLCHQRRIFQQAEREERERQARTREVATK